MQTRLEESLRQTPAGREAEAILRKCTHCGFCLATCPTYRLLGDELDSPRGRIYQIKQALEGAPATASMQLHLDRCLTCRACETTCPSGVEYARLADIGRELLETRHQRPRTERWKRALLRAVLKNRPVFTALLSLGRAVRPLLPRGLRGHVPRRRSLRGAEPRAPHATAAGGERRRVLMLRGCVQPALVPAIDQATVGLLADLGIAVETAPKAGCCGAVDQHLGAGHVARKQMRRNVAAWQRHLDDGAEALLANASGCAVQIRDYAAALADEPDCAEAARRVAHAVRDPVELLEPLHARLRPAADVPRRIVFQAPCTQQHGLRLSGRVEQLLRAVGFEVLPAADAHQCCGAAGTYSLLQPHLAEPLRERKLAQLRRTGAPVIATANVGCLVHLQAASDVPVRHWIELLEATAEPDSP